MARPLLEVDGLRVRYGPIEAVRGISFEVGEGEVVALLGANGAGKTSTLAALSGLIPRAGGSVRLAGEEIAATRPERVVRQGLALSPEGRRVFPALTVEQNLQLGGIPLGERARVQERREEVYELFPRLRERREQAAGTLSGGEQQMLAIGRALMAKPRVLLLDEPSLGLAPIVVEQLFELIQGLREQGTTMLLVEQNARRALEVADRVYVLVHGVITVSDSAEHMRANADLESLYLEAAQ